MATTINNATLTVTVQEEIKLNGVRQDSKNVLKIANINEISKRIVTVPTSEVIILSMSTTIGAGTFDESKVRYIRITNLDDANYLYLVAINEHLNEFCVKLDYGQSFIYNGDHVCGVIDTMLANQIALNFTEATGNTNDDFPVIGDITATNKIIPGLRYAHDGATIASGATVAATNQTPGADVADGYEVINHTIGIRDETTGEIALTTPSATDNDGTATYSAGFGDLVEITAEADTAAVDVEVFVASK